ncbi:endo-beta-N-acetylglucosaminidase [Bowmanella denitrificans]|uniref:endo-beta-N-acetylglucosaminidase n=1 Tax=Bowmanella denitrificans TaxID=366582 RepID=UPI001FEC3611|nr:endo-beta-N-acetylglucosaminidase [Bowmanella denitrificans]
MKTKALLGWLLALMYCAYLPVSAEPLASIQSSQPPFALTIEQTRNWSPEAATANRDNVSNVALARRFSAPLPGQQGSAAKVLYAPDGMNNFANYLRAQPQFNLYNFTHWSQIDVLNWFAGTADLTVQIPARPWVDTAHKNGVKVIGSVFLGVAQWGGNADTVAALLEQDSQGRFILADKLIEIASFYGFDGWLINQETDLTAVKDADNQLVKDQRDPQRGRELASRMLAFMQYLTANAPQGMEIHWYDSMLASGEVRWQNQLNDNNQAFLQDQVRSSDAIFLNYWWNQQMVQSSVAKAREIGRSPFDVYVGADLWPSRNAQRAFSRYQWLDWLFEDGQALASIALFAPNVNYNFDGEAHTPAFSQFDNDAQDEAAFYASEVRLFAGDDLNLASLDKDGWKGIGAYLPVKSTITALPFVTSFNTGQGKVWMENGDKRGGPWTDMSRQDLLPTWQFAHSGPLSLHFDFDQVFAGGSSIAIQADKGMAGQAQLFATELMMTASTRLKLVTKGDAQGLALSLQTADGQSMTLAIKSSTNWATQRFELAELAGKKLTAIGLQTNGGQQLQAYLGHLELLP